MKYKIEAVGKQSTGISQKNNKPWFKVGLKIAGDWYNGFHPENWTLPKPGDELELELSQEGQFKNFKLPEKGKVDVSGIEGKLDSLISKVDRLERMVEKIGKHLFEKPEKAVVPKSENLVPDPPGVDDLPF